MIAVENGMDVNRTVVPNVSGKSWAGRGCGDGFSEGGSIFRAQVAAIGGEPVFPFWR